MITATPSQADIERLAMEACRDAEPPDIQTALREQLEQDANQVRPYVPSVHMAGQCPRKLSYHALGIPPSDPSDPRMAIVWKTGDAIEQLIDEYLRRTGLHITHYQRRVRIPFAGGTIWGRLDRICEPDSILDYKSINTYGYDEVLRSGPKTEHVAQINLYLHALQLEGETRFNRGLLLYVDKNSGAHSLQAFRYSRQLAEATIAVFDAVYRAAASGQLLPRPEGYTPSSYPCSFCRWKSACWVPEPVRTGQALDTAVADLSALEDTMRRYVELSRTRSDIDRELEQLRAAVQAALTDAGAVAGQSASYAARLVAQQRTDVDMSRLPPLWVPHVTVTKTVHVLRIRPRTPPGAARGAADPLPAETTSREVET